MSSFHKNQTLKEFQDLIGEIYALPDDRLYSIWDLLTQQQRFTMRTLKGIRKGNIERVKHNLLISFSWLMAIGNRLHIHIEEDVWRRFPRMCSYCGSRTCVCKKEKPAERRKIKIDNSLKPENLKKLQEMFETIYPSRSVHLRMPGFTLLKRWVR